MQKNATRNMSAKHNLFFCFVLFPSFSRIRFADAKYLGEPSLAQCPQQRTQAPTDLQEKHEMFIVPDLRGRIVQKAVMTMKYLTFWTRMCKMPYHLPSEEQNTESSNQQPISKVGVGEGRSTTQVQFIWSWWPNLKFFSSYDQLTVRFYVKKTSI